MGSDTSLTAFQDRENPYLNLQFEPQRADKYELRKTYKAHIAPISALALHPKKSIVATASDDHTWKMWSIPNGELILTGEGHKSWVSCIDFHPKAATLATSSGDGTVKLWDFAKSKCVATLSDHAQAVWGVAYHDSGDFVASCSMDHTAKLWDVARGKCRGTLRGHVDSVNAIIFQPFSNNICTCAGDKTVRAVLPGLLLELCVRVCLRVMPAHDVKPRRCCDKMCCACRYRSGMPGQGCVSRHSMGI